MCPTTSAGSLHGRGTEVDPESTQTDDHDVTELTQTNQNDNLETMQQSTEAMTIDTNCIPSDTPVAGVQLSEHDREMKSGKNEPLRLVDEGRTNGRRENTSDHSFTAGGNPSLNGAN